MKAVSLRVRKRYFDDIVSGKKQVEYRKCSLYWLRRFIVDDPPEVAVFVCGKRVHRRKIVEVKLVRTPANFSEQGKKDVPTSDCFAIHLGGAAVEEG